MIEPGLFSCNYHIHERQSRTEQGRYLTSHADRAVSQPVLQNRNIMQRTEFGCSQFLMTKREMVFEMSVYLPFNHSTRLLAREYFTEYIALAGDGGFHALGPGYSIHCTRNSLFKNAWTSRRKYGGEPTCINHQRMLAYKSTIHGRCGNVLCRNLQQTAPIGRDGIHFLHSMNRASWTYTWERPTGCTLFLISLFQLSSPLHVSNK